MRKVGISDYETFAKSVLEVVKDKPISFEVFLDEFPEMRRQARKISACQSNVYVKIPITNTRGDSAIPLVRDLAGDGVQLNITAILTHGHVQAVTEALNPDAPAVVSVFAAGLPIPVLIRCHL
jgi:transaldolase